ncbi:hypothetical protein SLI_2030 [Streptomyces lividans 1326]|uniref:Uncharacterized protein n=1 Tax=Streptomyces lividans 1326 TaxID=1200984 RepID=A0A7U9DQS9_STRLI|nr:hypothetical protein SLI_2030 [Streptomyces lividans 1326]
MVAATRVDWKCPCQEMADTRSSPDGRRRESPCRACPGKRVHAAAGCPIMATCP